MRGSGSMARPMAGASSLTLMEMCMKEIGKMIRLMGRECILIAMVPDMKDSGKMICNVEGEDRRGPTVAFMRASTKMERSTDSGSTCGQMAASMKEAG